MLKGSRCESWKLHAAINWKLLADYHQSDFTRVSLSSYYWCHFNCKPTKIGYSIFYYPPRTVPRSIHFDFSVIHHQTVEHTCVTIPSAHFKSKHIPRRLCEERFFLWKTFFIGMIYLNEFWRFPGFFKWIYFKGEFFWNLKFWLLIKKINFYLSGIQLLLKS